MLFLNLILIGTVFHVRKLLTLKPQSANNKVRTLASLSMLKATDFLSIEMTNLASTQILVHQTRGTMAYMQRSL
jgi:hypothetical protein